jgi:L-lactate dehydrogenase complex protein LldF
MSSSVKSFLTAAEGVAFDIEHRDKIKFNIGKYNSAVEKGRNRYGNIELAKQRAGRIKREVLNNLPSLLIQFEKSITKNGARVYWADDSKDAVSIAISETEKIGGKTLVKSKSMITEEIDFNESLERQGIESIETDLGEFIVQVAGERPYHIVTPAMHKSKEDVAEFFTKHFNTPDNLTPEELTLFVRKYLRKKFINADVGVNGANFLVAREGAVAVTENEGNALLSASMPRLHIVIAGIEKIIPNIDDLDIFWPLLAVHGTGQQMTVYNNLFFGPRKNSEQDGPEQMVVILVNNGRTKLFEDSVARESLACIRCGACLNTCPVYKNIGGYTYDTTYSGPIGAVITPHLKEFKKYKHLSFASSLCGKCVEVCPVKIPLTNLLLHNRQIASKQKLTPAKERFLLSASTIVLLHRYLLDLMNGKLKTLFLGLFNEKIFGKRRELDGLPKRSFSKQWKEKREDRI